MATLWRLTRRDYANTAFSGDGARRYGGRFNPPGIPVVYTSESLALALVEVLVGLTDYEDLGGYVYFRVSVPDEAIETLPETSLPDRWNARPPERASQKVGETWATSGRSLGLSVPSVVVPHSCNVLLNPRHRSMGELDVEGPEPMPVDARLTGS